MSVASPLLEEALKYENLTVRVLSVKYHDEQRTGSATAKAHGGQS